MEEKHFSWMFTNTCSKSITETPENDMELLLFLKRQQ